MTQPKIHTYFVPRQVYFWCFTQVHHDNLFLHLMKYKFGILAHLTFFGGFNSLCLLQLSPFNLGTLRNAQKSLFLKIGHDDLQLV
jgi:hypothetical protein